MIDTDEKRVAIADLVCQYAGETNSTQRENIELQVALLAGISKQDAQNTLAGIRGIDRVA